MYKSPLARALHHTLAHFDQLDTMPVAAPATLATLRARLDVPLPAHGAPAATVVDDLARDVSGGLMGSSGGRFFGWVIGGSLPAALGADWLASAWEQNAALYACSPAAAVVEETAGRWLKEVLGLPPAASFAFVTGCQMAHVTALAAARHGLLARQGWDVEQHGLHAAPRLRVLTSQERHGTADRALRLLGIGLNAIELLPVNPHGQLEPAALAAALARDSGAPTLVILQAGDVNTGAFDDFATLVPLAHRHHAWVHVDGAFGLWAGASPRLRHLVAGAAAADSWATDGHKWLNVPFDCGYAFVADPAAHHAAFAFAAPYIEHNPAARDQVNWNPEWSRRARGFATYAALRQLGRNGVADLVERCCDHARALTCGIGALPGAEVVWEPGLNQGLVRYLHPAPAATPADHDRHTDAVIAAINASGEAFFGGTTWRGRRAMRISVSNWHTTSADVARTITAARQALAILNQQASPAPTWIQV